MSYQKNSNPLSYERVRTSEADDEDLSDQRARRASVPYSALAVLATVVLMGTTAMSLWGGGDDNDASSTFLSMSLFQHSHEKKHSSWHKLQANAGLQLPGLPPTVVQEEFDRLVRDIDWDAVESDIESVLTNSQEFWPADYGNYGGLFIRLAWHACGSYRVSDGRGGCDGGAQRFDPERSWADNTNLDKARRLLEPIKQKYGNGLSYGDLYVLAGTVAIRSMGGPVLGFCAGRVDVQDNSQTLALGPSPEQDKFAHCEVPGACPFPLGQNTLGLVYVNPEGPFGEPDLVGAAQTIRDVFGRMEWQGREVVALIGGGHTFGKTHGASNSSNGDVPAKCPFAPWNGPKGMDTITSGFEGPWTSNPTQWDNDYFRYLVNYEWEAHKGPGGHWQWRVKSGDGPKAPVADPSVDATQDVMMLTTDVALTVDTEYKEYVKEFANNATALSEAFAHAWYKLVTRDMGPYTRCVGPKVPPAQHFQYPLPEPPAELADLKRVTKDLHVLIDAQPVGAEREFVRLAYNCASTYRATDYLGGCNGARIRFPPGSEWEINAGLDNVWESLSVIKKKYGHGLSWADLIVLAGNVAAERLGSPKLKFCPGRTDAEDGDGWKHIGYKVSTPPATVEDMIELYQRRGQTAQQFVALTYLQFGSSNGLRAILIDDENHPPVSTTEDVLFVGLKYYPELRQWADYYAAAGNHVYAHDFADAWTRLMNADRFDGPVHLTCSI